jgi:probable F420-dependent oxidoreductase
MVQFGVSLPTIGMEDPQAVRLVAQQAEAEGLDSVWAADHVVLPTGSSSPYPYSETGEFLIQPGLPFLDQFTTLAYVAGCTSRVRLGTAVTLLPLRHPLLTAKTVATLDVLSGGRVTLGVAAGWLEQEFQVLDVSFEDRGALLDEGLDVMRAAWTQTEVSYEGRFYRVHGVASYPHPAQKPHPPIWVGGHTKPAMRRAAQYGSAWVPPLYHVTPQSLAEAHARVQEMARGFGRRPEEVELALRVLVDLRDEPDEAGAAQRNALYGDTAVMAATLRDYVNIGVSHFIFLPQARSPAEVQQTVHRLTQELVPRLRE